MNDQPRIRIGVDVGGTFTDFTILDETSGDVEFFKIPSTPRDPSEAIEDGVRRICDLFHFPPEAIVYFGHGTTVATNIVIEKRGARVGLLTTKGFRDVLELGRQARPSIYDYRVGKPPVLVPRDRRHEIVERIGANGEAILPVDELSVDDAVAALNAQKVESVAICFLHSYLNSGHERRVEAAVKAALPDAFVSVSSTILPEFREFERISTIVVNAYIGPRMGRYLDRFAARMADAGVTVSPYTIHSNGGLMSMETVRDCPVRTCVSGPAAGVVGAAEIGAIAGHRSLITFDVGGTSTDVSLVHEGRPIFTSSRLVAGYPVKTPMIDIHVIGAGGGSLAVVDDAGALKVGPQSAGADPGPVAYGRGGVNPTITDANLVLGRLDARNFIGGRMKVDLDAARAAIRDRVASPLRLSLEEAAHGVIQIANANMSRAIRSISIERGYDLSEFALCAFGGAGPMHAAEVAIECGIPQVLLPREPGTLCARGILLSDLTSDYVKSCFGDADQTGWARVLALCDEMIVEGNAWLDREKVPAARRRFRRIVDARYRGQNFEVKVSIDGLGAGDADGFIERFHDAHRRENGYDIRTREIEFVTCRVQAIGETVKAPMSPVHKGGRLADAVVARRNVYIDTDRGWCEAPVYERSLLPTGIMFDGLCIVNEMSATTLILPGQSAAVDMFGNIIVNAGRRSAR